MTGSFALLVFLGYPVLIAVSIVFGFAALAGLRYGLGAWRAMRGHPNRASLRLMALNLLEPSATAIAGYAFVTVFEPISDINAAFRIAPLVAGFSLSLMLLAPFFAPSTLPFRNTIAVWGRLRWMNTVSLWIMLELAFLPQSYGSSDGFVGLLTTALALAVSGIVILCLSISKILSILRKLEAVGHPEPTLEP